jgi:hypothetical protein
MQQQVVTVVAAVLRRQVLVHAGGAGLVPGMLKRLGAVDRRRRSAAFAETRAAGEKHRSGQEEREAGEQA